MAKTILQITHIVEEYDGAKSFFVDDVKVALRDSSGKVRDLRKNPPFLAMSPCPYCDAKDDRGHDPLKHTA